MLCQVSNNVVVMVGDGHCVCGEGGVRLSGNCLLHGGVRLVREPIESTMGFNCW